MVILLNQLIKRTSSRNFNSVNMAQELIKSCFSKESTEPTKKPNGVRLYSFPLCPFAERSRLAIAAKELDFEVVNINLRSKPDWYFGKHKLGKVPALELPSGKILVESTIIAQYIDEAYDGKRKLEPVDLYEKYRQRAAFENMGNMPATFGQLFRTKDLNAFVEGVESNLKILENYLDEQKTTFIGSNDAPTMLDYLLWPFLERLPPMVGYARKDCNFDGYLSSKFPLAASYRKAMLNDNAVKKVGLNDEIHEEYFLDHFGFSK